jgi:hypothetical protein
VVEWLVEKITQRRAKRSRQNERSPEQSNATDEPRPAIRRDTSTEEPRRLSRRSAGSGGLEPALGRFFARGVSYRLQLLSRFGPILFMPGGRFDFTGVKSDDQGNPHS